MLPGGANIDLFVRRSTRAQRILLQVGQTDGAVELVLPLGAKLGEALEFTQDDVTITGHAIEVRINAEDPARGFAPSPGRMDLFEPPGGPGVRIDTHCHSGYVVPPNYDSLIAKLIVHRPTRQEAINTIKRALHEFRIGPIKTTVPLHDRLMRNGNFVNGNVDIHFVERLLEK